MIKIGFDDTRRATFQRTICACVLVMLFFVTIAAGGKKKASVNPRLVNAQFICIVSASGDDLDSTTQRGDRAAILAVENAINKWGRYRIVYNQDDADIVLEVRTGRTARGTAGGGMPVGSVPIPGVPGTSNGGGVRIGGQPTRNGGETDVASVSEDMISVYDNHIGMDNMKSTSVLWRRIKAHGLVASPDGEVSLVEDLKKDVEEAAQTLQPKKP